MDMVAALAHDCLVGKIFRPMTDAREAMKLEREGRDVIWADSIRILAEALRDRSGPNNVVVLEDHDRARTDSPSNDHHARIPKIYELNAPVFTNPLDAKAALINGGGKAIFYSVDTNGSYTEAVSKITKDGTIRISGSDYDYITDAAGQSAYHRFILFKSYDKVKARKASVRRKAWIVEQGQVNCNDLDNGYTVLIQVIQNYYSDGEFHWFVNWQRPQLREALYKAIVVLSRRIDQLVWDEYSGKKVNKFEVEFCGPWYNNHFVKIPYWKWVIGLRQYRKGLLKTKDAIKTRTSTKREWNSDQTKFERTTSQTKVKVDGKSAREFGKWLDSEVRACIQYARAKKAKKKEVK